MEPENAQEEIDALIGMKAARHVKVFKSLTFLAGALPPQEFKLFCQLIPSGAELWDRFLDAAGASDCPETFGWMDFVRQVFQERKLDILAPPDCQASPEQKQRYVAAASGKLVRLGTAAIIAQHLGDRDAISQVTQRVCVNCTHAACPHWFGWNSFPSGQWM